ncbi:MAG TPA: AAA family ATPase [Thermodesulfovibrionales bacterium]|nr:AAA family ATPase [Thermodesulfovibrionales bacterium]
MTIGLCGSHRTGKTTLAEEISQRRGIPFVRTSTSDVFREHGLDPSEPMEIGRRLWIQHKILDAAEEAWNSGHRQFITDRTPLDMAAYTLADVQGPTEVDFAELEGYLDRCIRVTNAFFKLLVLVQPGIPLVYETGKAALNEGYLEHLNFLILGLCNDDRIKSTFLYLHRNVTDKETRVNKVMEVLDSLRAGTRPR